MNWLNRILGRQTIEVVADTVEADPLAEQSDEVITERMMALTEAYNPLWAEARRRKLGLRPWVDWQEKELLLTEWSGESIILAPYSRAEHDGNEEVMERTGDD